MSVAGASGYAGGELLRLIDAHPDLDLAAAAAHGYAGEPITSVHPHLVTYAERVFAETTAETLGDADLVFLALPHGASAALAEQLSERAAIIDLGADFRLADADQWALYYGGTHAGTWVYGLPELPGQRARIAGERRIANPGCYATAVTLALAPLVAADVIEPHDVVVVASSGTSGAGRSPEPSLLATEIAGDLSPYKVGVHQHVPEIKQATGATGISMTPVLAPVPRGILATVTAKPAIGTDASAVVDALRTAYDAEPFVHVLPAGQWPHTRATTGSNSCLLQAATDRDTGRVIVVSAIDNLGKGAAGQAIQNANLVLGLPEASGLTAAGVGP